MNEFWLIPIAFLTSILSGFSGLGGGMILMGIMSSFFAPFQLIPLHAIVQFGSNSSRVAFNFKEIQLKIVWHYALGAIVGALIGAFFVISISERILWFSLGSFLLVSTWSSHAIRMPKSQWAIQYPLLGLVSTFLALFVGVAGPLVHPFLLKEKLDRHAFIGTDAACAGITHLFKLFVFVWGGFTVQGHELLLAGMILASIGGSYVAKKFLNKTSDRFFYICVKTLISALALRMLYKGYLLS